MNTEFPDETHRLMADLDQVLPPGSNKVVPVNNDPLIEAAQRLATGPDLKLSNTALDRIEARLRARTVEVFSAPTPRPATPSRPARRSIRTVPIWRYALAASLVLVLVITSVTSASAQSLPGNRLYPVKRALEDGRLALVSTDGEPKLRISLAEKRTGEFEDLLDRNRVYPRSLEEANSHINRALDLLASGYGNWRTLQPRVIELVQKQDTLLSRALPVASVEGQARLQVVVDQNQQIKNRASQPTITPPAATAPLPIPTATFTEPAATSTPIPTLASPSPTNTAQPTLTATTTPEPTVMLTPTSTATKTPKSTSTQTPVPSRTPVPSSTRSRLSTKTAPDTLATRTPPGHGDKPGLGDNPPGHGGDNPGVGNDGVPPGQGGENPGQGNNGQPPGQQKPKKEK